MPGVPKSQGCENCRRRKKGCDLSRPTCGRCTKLGLECGRFGKPFKFVDETGGFRSKSKASDALGRSVGPVQASQDFPIIPTQQQTSLAKSSFQAQALGIFWDAYAPQQYGNFQSINCSFGTLTSLKWLHTALLLSHTDPALNSALSALALTHASRIGSKTALKRCAMLFYDASIREIRMALNDESRSLDDSLLAAIMVLGIYEVHEGTRQRGNAWVAHVDGASRLIIHRGLKNAASDFGRSLYFGHLMNEFISAVGSRNAFRFSVGAAAQSPPCGSIHDSENTRFIYILSQIPTLMQKADAIKGTLGRTDIGGDITAFHIRCKKVIGDLEQWHEDIKSSQNRLLYWPKISQLFSQLPPDSSERIFPTYICFADVSTAYQTITFWTFLLLIHSTVFLTYNWLHQYRPEIPLHSLIPPTPQHKKNVCHELATNIAQSLEYFAQPGIGLVGVQQIGFPMSVAMGYFSYFQAREMLWFRVIFRRLREMDMNIEGFLADLYTGEQLKLLVP